MSAHGGAFPRDAAALEALPGIGRSTAAAIAAFSSGARVAILDGNVKRVLARHAGVEGWPGVPRVEAMLWDAAVARLPAQAGAGAIEAYTQGMMDLGATVCTRSQPRCDACPVSGDCTARREGRIDALPSPRPVKALPHRELRLLVIEHDGAVLFERRPASGIWGGLWSLPECALEDDAHAIARERYGVEAANPVSLPPLEHGFTHYTLTLHPVRLVAVGPVPHAADAHQRAWLTAQAAAAAGLPAPIRRLVRSLDLAGFALVPGPGVVPSRASPAPRE